jgi:N-acetylneuraminic acid mutarotase
MFTPRAEGHAMVFEGLIYVFGGIGNKHYFPQDICVYNPTSDVWRNLRVTRT